MIQLPVNLFAVFEKVLKTIQSLLQTCTEYSVTPQNKNGNNRSLGWEVRLDMSLKDGNEDDILSIFILLNIQIKVSRINFSFMKDVAIMMYLI